jgi:hypothetical protein
MRAVSMVYELCVYWEGWKDTDRENPVGLLGEKLVSLSLGPQKVSTHKTYVGMREYARARVRMCVCICVCMYVCMCL